MVNMQCLVVVFIICNFVLNSSYAKPQENGHPRTFERDLSKEKHIDDNHQHNVKYDHEAFLGKQDSEKFKELTPEESKNQLKLIIKKIDLNEDGKVLKDEMHSWLKRVSQKYVQNERDKYWKDLDIKGDTITWEDYKLRTVGEEKDLTSLEELSRLKMTNTIYRRRWQLADRDGDDTLSKDEMLAFLHPEEYSHTSDAVVEEAMKEIDKNGDNKIDENEYINDLKTKNEHMNEALDREDFRTHRDVNRDGVLDKSEMKEMITPSNYNAVESETAHLFSHADEDKNDVLTPEEILKHHDIFVASQATVYGEALKANNHQEL